MAHENVSAAEEPSKVADQVFGRDRHDGYCWKARERRESSEDKRELENSIHWPR